MDLDASRFRVHRASPRGFAQAYAREGEGGTPLLLLHGWPETRRIWWRNIAPLAELGFEVIAPDLRGFGDSEVAPDGVGDVLAHSLDLYALVRRHLGHERVSVVAGDLGGAIAHDLSLRFPGFVHRLVIFDSPLACLRGDVDPLTGLDTDDERRRYIASFYTSRIESQPGAFTAEMLEFLTKPFDDRAKLRAGIGTRERVGHEPLLRAKNPTPALIVSGTSDRVLHPDFDRRAAIVFPNHASPLHIPDAGHFLQWEAAEVLNEAIRQFCPPEPGPYADGERAFVSLGSNLGAREVLLCAAVAALRATPGIRGVVVSPVYETDPVGPGPQGPYLNAVARLETRLTPRALLERLLEIERVAGRERGAVRDMPRSLDLDLLLFGALVLDEPHLQVPHPRLHERGFVLEPLCELAPDQVHPILHESIEALAARVRDPVAVRRRDG